MSDSIFLIRDDGTLARMVAEDYDAESTLQGLIEQYPDLIPGAQIDPEDPRRWILVAREVGIPAEEGGGNWWSIDHLLLDQDGIPTFVEVKRSSDTRIRREVVGQMLDYAAHASVYWPSDRIRSEFAETCRRSEINPSERLAEQLGVYDDEAAFWEAVQENLTTGRVRLLFVADKIPDTLRRIVEFLNEQMHRTEVLAIEIPQDVGEQLRSLSPRTIGRTSERKSAGATRRRRKWDEKSFFEELQETAPDAVEAARWFHEWANTNGWALNWGTGQTYGSFAPYLSGEGNNCRPIVIYSTGRLAIRLSWLKNTPLEEDRMRLRESFNSINGIDIPPEGIEQTEPEFELAQLSEESFRRVVEVLASIKDAVEQS